MILRKQKYSIHWLFLFLIMSGFFKFFLFLEMADFLLCYSLSKFVTIITITFCILLFLYYFVIFLYAWEKRCLLHLYAPCFSHLFPLLFRSTQFGAILIPLVLIYLLPLPLPSRHWAPTPVVPRCVMCLPPSWNKPTNTLYERWKALRHGRPCAPWMWRRVTNSSYWGVALTRLWAEFWATAVSTYCVELRRLDYPLPVLLEPELSDSLQLRQNINYLNREEA